MSPSMNKLEIREYLTKIYGLSVQKVMTANFAGMSCLFVWGVGGLGVWGFGGWYWRWW